MKTRAYKDKEGNTILYYAYAKQFADARMREFGDPVVGMVIRCANDERLIPEDITEWKKTDGLPSKKLGVTVPLDELPKQLAKQAKKFEDIFRDAVRHNDIHPIHKHLRKLSAQKRTPPKYRTVRVNGIPMSQKTAANFLKTINATVDGRETRNLSEQMLIKKLTKAVWKAQDGTDITVE